MSQSKDRAPGCPNDTNGDGDCGQRGCPHCGTDPQILSWQLGQVTPFRTMQFGIRPGEHWIELGELEMLLVDVGRRMEDNLPDRPELSLGVRVLYEIIATTRRNLMMKSAQTGS